MERFMGLLGVLAFLGLAYGLSRHRHAIHWKTVAWGLGLQWIFAVIVLKGDAIKAALGFLPWPTLHVFHEGTAGQWTAQFGWVVLLLMFVPMLLPSSYAACVLISAVLWSAGFGLYAIRYWTPLTQARIDGKPG